MKCKDCTNYVCHHRTTDAEKDCFFEEQMIIKTNKLVMEFIDWNKFRREAAKDILCAMIQGGYGQDRIEHQSELAVRYTTELVKQLKEKEEKL